MCIFSGYDVVSYPITDQFPYEDGEDPMALMASRSNTNLSEVVIQENETGLSINASNFR